MRSGQLRHKVIIQVLTETRDSMGGVAESWATFQTRWAEVKPITGKERYASAERTGETTHHITMRHTAGITRKHRILWGARVFDIQSVINADERDRMTVIQAVERD